MTESSSGGSECPRPRGFRLSADQRREFSGRFPAGRMARSRQRPRHQLAARRRGAVIRLAYRHPARLRPTRSVMRPLAHALLAILLTGSAAPAAADLWQDVDQASFGGKRFLDPAGPRTLALDRVELQSLLARAPMELTQARGAGVEIALPTP